MRKYRSLYSYYNRHLMDTVKHIRGSTRLSVLLKKLALYDLEDIDQKPQSIFNKDNSWKNLIILDACRHDTYRKLVDSSTDKRITLGSNSGDYIEKTFSDGNFDDIVYITANPWFEENYFKKRTGKEPQETFHDIFQTWRTDWDEDCNTVLPDPVIRDALTAEKLYPEKRKIIHFMQPHYPFINYTQELHHGGIDKNPDQERLWSRAEKGDYKRQKLIEAYEDNLDYVNSHLASLKEGLKGKTIVTADHGNFMGEKGIYGHPGKSNKKSVREVPWNEINE